VNWTQLLKEEAETSFASVEKLIGKVDADGLAWKPATGGNWMTVGQLLKHLSESCGMGCKGFVTGDWGLPAGVDMKDLPPEEMMPPAEKLPASASVAEALQALRADKDLALRMISQAGEDALANKQTAAPWEPEKKSTLGRFLLMMIRHLDSHKSQLFYYLKLQGKPVNTGDLW
jgi:hypothetical protein